MRFRLTGLAALMASLAVACGGDSSAPAVDSSASNGGPTSSSPQETTSGQVGTEEFGMNDEQLVTAIDLVESLIASCMAEAGFEYTAIDTVSFREAMDTLNQPPGLADEEIVAQYGYGISTMPPVTEFGFGPENEALRASLSQADEVAYLRTLLGDDLEATFIQTLEDEDFADVGGCTQESVEAVFTSEQLDPNFQNPFDVLVAADPRMRAANEEWSACMGDEGFDFDTPDDAEDEIADRLETLTDGEDASSLSGGDLVALAEIQADERAIAVLDEAYQEEHLREVEEQVERDISGQT